MASRRFLVLLLLLICLKNVKSFYTIQQQLDDDILVNDRPVIGILSQEMSSALTSKFPHKSYIAASYVKFVESSGARVIPIWIGKSESYYNDLLGKINGVIFPGGSADFNNTNGYAEAGKIIYRIATEMNNDKDNFPILGICLGFELLSYLAAAGVEHRFQCSSINQVLPLEFYPGFEKSKLFRNGSEEIINIFKWKNVTANFHSFCIDENSLTKVNLTGILQILSTNIDSNGNKFISSFEHRKLPYYALQFHPEKNNYEWVIKRKVPHSSNAIKISQYLSNFFIDQARKSRHIFPIDDENYKLIYHYNVTYTADKIPAFEQMYFFD